MPWIPPQYFMFSNLISKCSKGKKNKTPGYHADILLVPTLLKVSVFFEKMDCVEFV